MKITVLAENTVCRSDVEAEHGLSLYIETADHKILFDMGQTDLFYRNAKKLGVDPATADIAILSHGHYDHGGGLATFREVNGNAPVYVSPYAFGDFYSDKFIGLSAKAKQDPHLVLAKGCIVLGKGITLYADCPIPVDGMLGKGLYRMEKGEKLLDDFRHEIYLVIEENGKKVLFSGCSHRGIVNITDYFRPDIVIGGFHLKKLDTVQDGDYLAQVAAKLMSFSAIYYTCHCTGKEQYAFLKHTMGEKLHYLACGETVIL